MSLVLENLSHEVDGVDFIRDANLTFEAGSFNVLLGRTLAGKDVAHAPDGGAR